MLSFVFYILNHIFVFDNANILSFSIKIQDLKSNLSK